MDAQARMEREYEEAVAGDSLVEAIENAIRVAGTSNDPDTPDALARALTIRKGRMAQEFLRRQAQGDFD